MRNSFSSQSNGRTLCLLPSGHQFIHGCLLEKLFFGCTFQRWPYITLPGEHKTTDTLTKTTQCAISQFKEHWTSLLISLLPLTICFRLDTGDLQTWLTTWINTFQYGWELQTHTHTHTQGWLEMEQCISNSLAIVLNCLWMSCRGVTAGQLYTCFLTWHFSFQCLTE